VCDPDDAVVVVYRSLDRSSLHASFAQSLSPSTLRVSASEGRMREERKNECESLDARSLFVFPVGIRVR